MFVFNRTAALAVVFFSVSALVACSPSAEQKKLAFQNQKLTEELTELKKQLEGKLSESDTSATELSRLTAELEESLEKADSLQARVEALQGELGTEKERVAEARTALETATARADVVEAELGQVKSQLEAVAAQSPDMQGAAVGDGGQDELSSIKAELEKTVGERDALAAENEKLEADLAAANRDKERLDSDVRQQLTEARDKAAELNTSYEKLLSEKQALERVDEQTRNELAEAQQAFEQAQSEVAKLSGARGVYTVNKGDSLSTIAGFFYRDMSKWEAILEENSHLIDEPNLIYVGMTLVIPAIDAN